MAARCAGLRNSRAGVRRTARLFLRHDRLRRGPGPRCIVLNDRHLGADRLERRELIGPLSCFCGATCWNSPVLDAALEVGADLAVGGFSHAAPQGIAEDVALIGDGLALEVAVAGDS